MTQQMLTRAKPYAASIVTRHSKLLQKHFSRFATRKYRCKPQQVKFDSATQLQLLKRAVLKECCDGILGETDGVQIWISNSALMTFDDVISVLIHEYLHNYCLVRGKTMSCHNEHQCMRGLGDTCS